MNQIKLSQINQIEFNVVQNKCNMSDTKYGIEMCKMGIICNLQ